MRSNVAGAIGRGVILRAPQALGSADGQPLVYDGAGGIYVASLVQVRTFLGLEDTDGLDEGATNLYYTDDRVDARVSDFLVAGSNITLTPDGNTLIIAASGGGGGSNPGGSDSYVQYNNDGVFGGSNKFTFDDVSGLVTVDGNIKLSGITKSIQVGTAHLLSVPGTGNTYAGTGGNVTAWGTFNTGFGNANFSSALGGDYNVALGAFNLANLTAASYGNIAIGVGVLFNNTSAHANIGIGNNVMEDLTTGDGNTVVGYSAGVDITTGYHNVALGALSFFQNTVGYNNTATGESSLYANLDGHDNVGVGYQAGYNSGTPANSNIGGSFNTYLGAYSRPNSVSQVENSTAVGCNAVVTASNQVVIGDTNVTESILRGTVNVTALKMATGASNGYGLKSDASGNASWAAINAVTVGGVTPSAFVLTLLDDASAAAFRTTLGIDADDAVTFGVLTVTSVNGVAITTGGSATQYLNGAGSYSTVSYASLSGVPSTFAPSAHASSHQSGGGDAIKLDDLSTPDDNTDLNASTTRHGLLPKLPNSTSKILDGTGAWKDHTTQITVHIGNGTDVITTGLKLFLPVSHAMTITGWRIYSADAAVTSGSIVIDVWKDTYANYPPAVADSIAGSEKPTLSAATKNEDTSLTTWTTLGVAAGDVLAFNVDSVTSLKKIVLIIYGVKP